MPVVLHALSLDGRPTTVALRRCTRFAERLAGLSLLASGHRAAGVWLEPCAAIHTFWMRRSVDVAFLGGDGRVLRIDRAVPPGRIRALRGARAVLEAPAGRIELWGVEPGRRLALVPVSPSAPSERG
jgi:hypothetical protein